MTISMIHDSVDHHSSVLTWVYLFYEEQHFKLPTNVFKIIDFLGKLEAPFRSLTFVYFE